MTNLVRMTRAGVCAAVLVSLSAIAAPAAAALVLSPRYASPSGSGTDCTKTNPCSIDQAINQSPPNGNVTITPGVYGSPSSPLTTQLTDVTTSGLHIHGQVGAPIPLVYSATNDEAIVLQNGSQLSHLGLVYSGPAGAVLDTNHDADHLAVVATGSSTYACGVFGDLSDSLCVDTGANGAAVELEEGGQTDTLALDNVTAIATNGTGILTAAGPSTQLTVNAKNTIVRGTQADVAAAAESGSIDEVHLDHSAYRTNHVTTTGPGTATVFNDGGNTAANPKFVGATRGDFREAAGSPTIDKGLRRIGHPEDLAGNPRTLGKTTDMGAYEFVPKPRVGKISVGHKGAHAVAVTVPVNPEGTSTSVRLVASHGHQRKKSRLKLAGDHATTHSIKLKVKGLDAATKYHLAVKATNEGGTTARRASAKTKAKPKHKHKHRHHTRA